MPLIWLSIAFLMGVLLASALPLGVTAWLFISGGSLAAFSLRKRLSSGLLFLRNAQYAPRLTSRVPRLPLPFSLLCLALCLGGLRLATARPRLSPDVLAWYNGRQGESEAWVVVEGVVVRPPELRDDEIELSVRAEKVRAAEARDFHPVHGRLLARLPDGGSWQYGDRVSLEGALVEPPVKEEYSYKEALARQGVYSLLRNARATLLARGQGSFALAAIYGLRERALATVYQIYPDPEASLLAGILLGIDSGIPEEVADAFTATGTAHIIAISG